MEQITNSDALEELLKDIEPKDIAEVLTEILLGYIPTSDFCESPASDRNNRIYVAKTVISFFNKLNKIDS